MERSNSWGKYSKSLEQVYEEIMDELFLEYHAEYYQGLDMGEEGGDWTGYYCPDDVDIPEGIPIGKVVL